MSTQLPYIEPGATPVRRTSVMAVVALVLCAAGTPAVTVALLQPEACAWRIPVALWAACVALITVAPIAASGLLARSGGRLRGWPLAIVAASIQAAWLVVITIGAALLWLLASMGGVGVGG